MKIHAIVAFCCLPFMAMDLAAQQPCVPAKHAKLPAIYSLVYHKARTKLLASGWQPLTTIHHNEADKNQEIAYGNGKIFWQKGYWEIEACSGTGLAPCSFLFRDAYGNKLRVTTAGEELPKQKAFASVTSFRFVCGND